MKLKINDIKELTRYGIVGVSLNSLMYFAYLMLTSFYLSPYYALMFLYPLGVLLGFLVHKRVSFKQSSNGYNLIELLKYIFIYVLGFLLNSLLLYVFVEKSGYPHQLVQLLSIFIVAAFLFISLKFFVFTHEKNRI